MAPTKKSGGDDAKFKSQVLSLMAPNNGLHQTNL